MEPEYNKSDFEDDGDLVLSLCPVSILHPHQHSPLPSCQVSKEDGNEDDEDEAGIEEEEQEEEPAEEKEVKSEKPSKRGRSGKDSTAKKGTARPAKKGKAKGILENHLPAT